MKDLLVRAARGERTERPPVWLMRQAGRYIPEYREIRSEYSFYEAITTPEVAERVTMLPWELFEPDGIVMYSDILTALEPLGFSYHIESGVGPVIENPVESPEDVHRDRQPVEDTLPYVGELLERLQERLDGRAAVLGFAGGPFTLAAYVCQGEPSRNFMELRRLRATDPEAFRTLLSAFADVVAEYLQYQVDHGADVVKLFDTYAGVLSPADYREFLLPLHREILESVDAPTMVFARNMGGRLELLAETGADVVALDWTVDMTQAREQLGDQPVQGNLDPSVLLGEDEHVREQTLEVIDAAGPEGHVLNLGHGLHRDTPVESVRTFVETAKSVER